MTTQIATATEGSLRWACAFAMTECLACGGAGSSPVNDLSDATIGYEPCQTCRSMGRAYALEGVRQRCEECCGTGSVCSCGAPIYPDKSQTLDRCGGHSVAHKACHGIGETPIEDRWTWLGVTANQVPTSVVTDGTLIAAVLDDDFRLILRPLARVLEGQGARLAWEEAWRSSRLGRCV